MKIWMRIGVGAIVPAGIVGTYAARTNGESDPTFPPLADIVQRFRELWLFSHVGSDVLPSLRNLAIGLLLGVVVGIVLGAVLGLVGWLHDALVGLLHFGRSVPPIMLIPPLVLVLGVGDLAKIAIIALGAMPPVCLATIDGIRQVETVQVDMARSIRLGRVATVRDVYLPSASPSIFGGIQIALQIAFVLMVASEMVAAFRGLGYLTMQAQQSFDSRSMWAGILLLALLGFFLNLGYAAVRNRVLAWHVGMTRAEAKR
jgi:sulfonate transport system permease protein